MPAHRTYFNPHSKKGMLESAARIVYHGYKTATRKRTAPPLYTTSKRRKTGTSLQLGGVIRRQAGRSTRKVVGRKKTKGIVHRKRSVKVSPTLRKKIKKVIAGTEIKGVYTAVRQGTIGFTATGATSVEYRRVTRNGGYALPITSTKIPKTSGANVRFWFAQPYTSKDGFTDGEEWQFFSPMKILDAASVIWNQKPINTDYTNQAINLNTVHNKTTGTMIAGNQADMNIKGLKIHVMNSYVSMVLKNNTERSVNIVVYKCVPAIKFPVSTALESFVDAITQEMDATNSGLVNISGPLADPVDNAVIMPGIHPNTFKAFSSSWKYTKVNINLSAGETTTMNFQGPKNYVLDYDKLNVGDDDKAHLAYKQTTMQVFMSVSPDLEFATNADTAFEHTTGRWWQTNDAESDITNPVSIEWKETYRLALPHIVGFQNGPEGVGGNKVTLNLRIPRRAYGNFVKVTDATTATTYIAHDEENPGAGIPQSIYN